MHSTAGPGALERVVLWARVSPPSGADTGRRPRTTRGETTYSLGGAIRALEARLQAGGGTIEAQLSGQLVCSFAADDALEAVELGLELLDEADGYDLTIALALSPTSSDGGVRIGAAFDDAFFLAARAKAGELLVDGALRDRVPGTFLLTRQVSQGGVRAGSIDRRHPRRIECFVALETLGPPPLVSATQALVAPLVEALAHGAALVVLEGPIGAGAAELIEAARAQSSVERCLWLGAAAGPLAALESVRLLLATQPGAEAAHARLAAAELPPLQDVVDALDAALGPARAWLVLNPLAGIDLASMEAVAALRRRRGERLACVVRAPLDAPLPELLTTPTSLTRESPTPGLPSEARTSQATARFTLPALRLADAREVVTAILGANTPQDVVRRVATIGGDSTLGCEEAARLLVAAGDLVREEGVFAWRTAPRTGVEGVSAEELALARMELLSDEARRVLEIASVAPRGASRELLRGIATHDGLGARAVTEALTSLQQERWLVQRDEPSVHFVRRVVQTAMPPSRLAELHRFALAELTASAPHRWTLAHYAFEGGHAEQATRWAREVGDALTAAGFVEAGARFSGTHVPAPLAPTIGALADEAAVPGGRGPLTGTYSALAPSSAGELSAATLARRRPSVHPALEDTSVGDVAAAHDGDDVAGPEPRALRAALRARDVGAIERWVEQATLAGADLATIARLRAVIDLLRGDFANAQARIARAGDDADLKPLLARSMVALGAGRSADAIRHALGALALSLRRDDARGRSAAYHALAACYRAEGRPEDAATLLAQA